MDELTCGKGLAENAAVPAMLGELIGAMAEVLEAHVRALDLADSNSCAERDAYIRLCTEQREIAARLKANGAAMAGYRDLPLARHDPKVMADATVVQVFERYIDAERQLVERLASWIERDDAMLGAMRGGGA